MAGVYQHRSMLPPNVSARLNELLDAVRNEFESVTQDTSIFKLQRDEFEHKIAAQINEMNSIQQNIYELERAHQKMKQQYEDEIMRLRRELEARGGVPPPSNFIPSTTSMSHPPPNIGGGNGGLFGGGGGGAMNRLSLASGYGQHHQTAGPGSFPVPKPSGQQGPPQLQSSSASAPGAVKPPQTSAPKSMIVFGDLELDAISPAYKREGADWIATFNPKLPKNNDMKLVASFDHQSVVCCVRFSTDGKFLATGSNRCTQIFDVAQGKKIASLVDENSKEGDLYIRSVCFSPDGNLLATGAEDKLIRVRCSQNFPVVVLQRRITRSNEPYYKLFNQF